LQDQKTWQPRGSVNIFSHDNTQRSGSVRGVEWRVRNEIGSIGVREFGKPEPVCGIIFEARSSDGSFLYLISEYTFISLFYAH
jgi:hypothetical protein